MRGRQQAIAPRGCMPRDSWAGCRAWPHAGAVLLYAFAVVALLLASSATRAAAAVVQQVEAAPTEDGLKVTITTDASEPPAVDTFPLRSPDRLVLQLPGMRWGPRFNRRVAAGRAGVERIRIAQYNSDPPITRLVFDLSVSPDRLRYQIVSRPRDGNLEISFSPPAPGPVTVTVPSRVTRRAPPPPQAPSSRKAAPTRRAPPSPQVEPAIPQPVTEPAPSTPLPAETGAPSEVEPPPSETPEPAAEEPAAATPIGLAPEPSTHIAALRSVTEWLGWALALILVALLVPLVGAILRDRFRTRKRRAQARQALQSEDTAERARALRELTQWSAEEVRSLRQALLAAAQDPSPDLARQASDLLRAAFPPSELIEELSSGPADAEPAALLALHPADVAGEPLFRAALSGPPIVRQSAMDALVKLAESEPIPPVLLALINDDEAARALSVEIIRAAGPYGARPLMSALSDTDELVRCGAIEALIVVAPEGSGKTIAARLADPLPHVRTRAARALGLIDPAGAFRDALLAALGDSSPAVQQAAALSLARIGDDLTDLLAALDRRAAEKPDLRFAEVLLNTIASRSADPFPGLAGAVTSLNRSFADGLIRALDEAGRLDAWLQLLAHADPDQRDLVISILRVAAESGLCGPLLRGLAASHPATQVTCAQLLGEIKEEAAIRPLAHLISLPEETLRVAAAQALGRIAGPDAATVLVTALDDPEPTVRTAAAEALGQALPAVEPPDERTPEQDAAYSAAASALARSLQDPLPQVRAAAARGLASLGADEAVSALVEIALHDPDQSVRAAVVSALGQMRAHDVLTLLMDVVNDPDPDLRCRAIEIFGRAGDPMVVDVLVNALQDEDLDVRQSAGRGLWEIATGGHAATLVPYLTSPDPKVRSAIAGVLGKVQAVEHADALAQAAADPDPFVRASVVNAFGSLGESAADHAPAVVERLLDADPFIRARAVEALSAMVPNDERIAHDMLPLVADPDAQVREVVAFALLGFVDRDVAAPLLEVLGDPGRRPEALQLLQQATEAQLRKLLRAARQATFAQQAAPDIGRTALETISYLLSKRWTPEEFRPELGSLDAEARLAGLEGLALIGTAEAMREVARVLRTDPTHELRIRAAEILAESPDPAAREALRQAAANDPDPRVRDAAALPTEHHSTAS
jgi:HEAT repeat protein